eukprot:6197401-Pleurochrysis_carterae.AAC.1
MKIGRAFQEVSFLGMGYRHVVSIVLGISVASSGLLSDCMQALSKLQIALYKTVFTARTVPRKSKQKAWCIHLYTKSGDSTVPGDARECVEISGVTWRKNKQFCLSARL